MTNQERCEIIEELKAGVELLEAASLFDEKAGTYICPDIMALFVILGQRSMQKPE